MLNDSSFYILCFYRYLSIGEKSYKATFYTCNTRWKNFTIIYVVENSIIISLDKSVVIVRLQRNGALRMIALMNLLFVYNKDRDFSLPRCGMSLLDSLIT